MEANTLLPEWQTAHRWLFKHPAQSALRDLSGIVQIVAACQIFHIKTLSQLSMLLINWAMNDWKEIKPCSGKALTDWYNITSTSMSLWHIFSFSMQLPKIIDYVSNRGTSYQSNLQLFLSYKYISFIQVPFNYSLSGFFLQAVILLLLRQKSPWLLSLRWRLQVHICGILQDGISH